ncbi:unnamed protein product [Chondrus crispus]|uniref:Uncharacterized protein n=1 Tax=Chondrus crispus TaxID=2769 RepID=R7QUQ1_CHOCR|nr:unnamed protein product [Chondrus crispus]CDF41060.1 unnamed protein product [Chondrus crispus]|eukprot:XP_005711354.1 unnamed protein product [Chondrus crispus]
MTASVKRRCSYRTSIPSARPQHLSRLYSPENPVCHCDDIPTTPDTTLVAREI